MVTSSGIAANASGRLYVIGPEGFFVVDRKTAVAQHIADNDRGVTLIDFAPDGTLVGLQPSSDDGPLLLSIDPTTGQVLETLDFVGGAAFDPISQSIVLAGSRDGVPQFAKGSIETGFDYFDAPAFAETGGIAVVNGQLLVPENGLENALARDDLQTFERLGEVPWQATLRVLNLTSVTSWGNSRYVTVRLDGETTGLSLGVSDASTSQEPDLDVNGDDVVDVGDAELIHAAIIGDVAMSTRFDLNQDMLVDAMDINYLALRSNAPPGDTNLDGIVDFADFLVMSAHFGMEVDCGWLEGDIDGNGRVEFADFLVQSQFFGNEAQAARREHRI